MNCNPWKNTNQYTVLNQDQNGEQQIDLSDYATLKNSNLDNHQLFCGCYISSYTFDTTEKMILIAT
jgi:dipeptidyl-peptidase-4